MNYECRPERSALGAPRNGLADELRVSSRAKRAWSPRGMGSADELRVSSRAKRAWSPRGVGSADELRVSSRAKRVWGPAEWGQRMNSACHPERSAFGAPRNGVSG